MSENSKIEWTTHTFNPWWGCTRVSPGCAHCYAETLAHRYGNDVWGKGKARKPASEKVWAEPVKWNKAAVKVGERHRVFCSSMADVFDEEAPEGSRQRLWALINATPELDWLLLTKRPENFAAMLPPDWGDGWRNVWLGVSVENQDMADKRISRLLGVQTVVRFLSVEPMLGPVNLRKVVPEDDELGIGYDSLMGALCGNKEPGGPRISWVIVGGESGYGARPMAASWALSLRDQCQAAGVAFFFKQKGGARDKGGDLESIPEDLRIREFPKVAV